MVQIQRNSVKQTKQLLRFLLLFDEQQIVNAL